MKKSSRTLKIRASQMGKLMVDSPDCKITVRQLATIKEYEAKENLTPRQHQELDRLIAKRDAPFELSQTAKSAIEDIWLGREYNHYRPMEVKETMKGDACEDAAIDFMDILMPVKGLRVTNSDNFRSEYFTGTPDIILYEDKLIEDIKCPWDLQTFLKAEPDHDYIAQAQTYMALTGIYRYRLCYVLVNTPDNILAQEIKRYYYKFGQDDDNEDYQRIAERLRAAHNFDHIPIEQRLKVWTFQADHDYQAEMVKRVQAAREYYDTLKLVEENRSYKKNLLP